MFYKLKNLSFSELLNILALKNLVKSTDLQDYQLEESTQNKFITFFIYAGSLTIVMPFLALLGIDTLIENLHFTVNIALGVSGMYSLAYIYENKLPKGDFTSSMVKSLIIAFALAFFAAVLKGTTDLVHLFKFSYSVNLLLISSLICLLLYNPIKLKLIRVVMLNVVFYTFLYCISQNIIKPFLGIEISRIISKYFLIILFVGSLAFSLAYKHFKNNTYRFASQILSPALYVCAIYIGFKYYSSHIFAVLKIDLFLVNFMIMFLILTKFKSLNKNIVNFKAIAAGIIILAIGYILNPVISCLILLSVLFYLTRSSNFILTMFLMPVALFQYYYSLNQSLDIKAYTLIISGILLLGLIPLLTKKQENNND